LQQKNNQIGYFLNQAYISSFQKKCVKV